MRFAMAALLCAAAVLAAPSARAERDKRPKAMVLDFPPSEGIAPATLSAMNEFLAAALRDQGFSVLTAGDIAAVLGVERQKQLLGCSESSCLAELGGAMGVDYLVRGTAAALDRDTALTLSLIEPRGAVVNQVRARVPSHSSSELVSALEGLVPQLVDPVRERHQLVPARPAPAGGLAAAPPPPPASGGVGRTVGLVLMGVGAAAVLVAGGLGAYAGSQIGGIQRDYDAARASGDAKRQGDLEQQATNNAVLPAVVGGAGLAVAGAGAAVFFLSGPGPQPAGGGAAVALAF